MCGIAGLVYSNTLGEGESEAIHRMLSRLKHRGPNDEGFFSDSHCVLGHRRLSIIDLSPKGRQPLFNEDRTVAVVCNGEIYNYRDLRKQLEKSGHLFYSDSDTEVIVHGYEQWGIDVLSKLDGMWAFALWDKNKNRLLLSRDRIGKRPLVYAQIGEQLIFASEINALMASGLVSKEMDMEALSDFFTFLFIPHPKSIYKNVRKLPPAHYLLWKNGNTSLHRYWDYEFATSHPVKGFRSEEELLEKIDQQLHDAVKKRLMSEVPVGAFLSGGLDSSVVVAIASQYYSGRLKTFSIGFAEESHNELPFAKQVAEQYGTEHYELVVTPKIQEVLFDILKNYGEPFADSSAIPSFYVARMAAEQAKVVLNGDGGDEQFLGYGRYFFPKLSHLYPRLPEGIRRVLRQVTHAWLPEENWPHSFWHRVRHRFDFYLDTPARRFYQDGFYSQAIQKKLFSHGISVLHENAVEVCFQKQCLPSLSLLQNLLRFDYLTCLTDDLMVKMDIACMANSLEARSPLLDPKLFYTLHALPFHKLASSPKSLFKQLILKKNYLPPDLVHRKKQGFAIPLKHWLRKADTRNFLLRDLILENPQAPEFFNMDFLRERLREHDSGQVDHTSRLWAVICFLVWHEQVYLKI